MAAVNSPPAEDTRQSLLRAAERLYAERGISEVSNRQVAEAAGQRNNSAVGYHIGTKDDMVRAISQHHTRATHDRGAELADRAARTGELRDYIACMVSPYVEYLAAQGVPGWTARFVAQVASDPKYADHTIWGPDVTEVYGDAISVVCAAAPLSPRVRRLRTRMVRTLLVHTCAAEETEAARTGAAPDWESVGEILVDAIAGLLLAPETGPRR